MNFRAEELEPGKDYCYTIEGFEKIKYPAEADGWVPVRLVLSFKDEQRTLTLNSKNERQVMKNLGEKPKTWIGKSITFFRKTVTVRGNRVPGIRIKPEAGAKPARLEDFE